MAQSTDGPATPLIISPPGWQWAAKIAELGGRWVTVGEAHLIPADAVLTGGYRAGRCSAMVMATPAPPGTPLCLACCMGRQRPKK